MRKLPLAVAALLACAVSPALAQTGSGTPAVEPPPAAQVAPNPPSPPKPEAIPAAPSVTDNAPAGRFSFNRVDDGFLRLDRQTGQVAYCSPHAVGWGCQSVPEDRAALEKEIARLRDEVAGLKAQVAALQEPPPRPPADLTLPPANPPPAAQTPPPLGDKDQDNAKLRADLERARLAFENAWRRLVEMIVNLQKDMMRKG